MTSALAAPGWNINPSNYPLDALGAALGNAVRQHARNSSVAVESVATSALASVMAATQGLADVQRPHMTPSPIGSLFTVVDETGAGKDTGAKPFTAPFHLHEQEQNVDLIEQNLEFDVSMTIWQARRKDLERQLTTHIQSGHDLDTPKRLLLDLHSVKPQPPKKRKIIHGDATPSGLKIAIANGSDHLFLLSTEADEIFNGALGRNVAFLNSVYDASDQTRTRVEGTTVVKNYRLTSLLTIQPSPFQRFLKRHGQHARDSGLLARLLVAVPHSTAGFRSAPSAATADNAHIDVVAQRISALLRATEARKERQVVEFDARAGAKFAELFGWMQQLMAPGGDLEHLAGHAARVSEHASRIACGLHIFEGREGPITTFAFEQAAQIAIWHLRQAHTLLTPLDPDHQASADVKAVGQAFLATHRWHSHDLSRSDVRSHCPGLTTGRVNKALCWLVEQGGLEPRPRGRYRATLYLDMLTGSVWFPSHLR